jgi:hypothetical protein
MDWGNIVQKLIHAFNSWDFVSWDIATIHTLKEKKKPLNLHGNVESTEIVAFGQEGIH